MKRILVPSSLLFLFLVLAAAAPGSRADEPPSAGHPGVFEAWIGLDGDDPFAADAGDPARTGLFAGMKRLLVRSTPVPWGRVVPVAPVMGGRQLHDWEALDRFVTAWQAAGHDVVLTLSPDASWLGRRTRPTAWEAAVAAGVPDAQRAPLVAAAREGLRALPDDRWDDWRRFVADLVERYDGDGREDAADLRRGVRWIQILDAPHRPSCWRGSPESYVRLLHEARLGARQASSSARIVHGGVRLPLCARVTEPGFAGLRRAFEGEAGSASAAVRTTGRWELEFARQTLLLSEVFDAVVLEGAGHLRDETDGLVQLNRLLREEAAAAGGRNVETWLERTPTAKIDASAKERPERVARAEARVRARWLATARIPGHGDRGEALAWFERGRAFDVARTLVNARVAGAHRVLLGRAARLPEDGRRSLAAFVRAEGQGRYTRRPAAWALEQAADRLGTPVRVEALPTSGRARTFRFTREPGNGPAWMVVVLPDPDRDWAGEPREAEKRGDVVLRIAPGLYSIQEVRISAEAPEVERRHVPDGVLRLDAGPSPIYVWPGR